MRIYSAKKYTTIIIISLVVSLATACTKTDGTIMPTSTPSFISTNEMVDICLDTIMESPREASNTYAYINAHKEQFDRIIGMGEFALPYLNEILNSGEKGLKAHIVSAAALEILKGVYTQDMSQEDVDIATQTEEALSSVWSNPYYENALMTKGGYLLAVWREDTQEIYYTLTGVRNRGVDIREIKSSMLKTTNIDYINHILTKIPQDTQVILSQINQDDITTEELNDIAKQIMFESIEVVGVWVGITDIEE
ncbi:MAG: hypothetical protein KAQ68_11530 [Clostridiales bacterium]|nr:hypothetical protein [Clostridiales bacterium]